MALLIDAYNVTHANYRLPERYEMSSASGLCRTLDRVRKGRVVVVADGSPKPDDRASADTGGVQLIFSGKGREADDVIEDLIEREADPRNLIVVSSDHRLQRAAQRRGATFMDAEPFLRKLAEALQGSDTPLGGPEKPVNTPDAAAWMKKFDIHEGPSAAGTPGARPDAQHIEDEADRWLKEFGIEPEED